MNDLPFLKEQGIAEPYYDIASPYGYGGPVFCCDSPDRRAKRCSREFNARFLEYCRSERLASEFTSLHPFLDGWRVLARSGLVGVEQRKEVVYMDLTGTEAERWKAVRKGHKSSITQGAQDRRAHREAWRPPGANFDELNRLYYADDGTQRRRRALVFPEGLFPATATTAWAKSGCRCSSRASGEATAAACILMHDCDTAYYHFSGSDERFNEFCPNNLLVFEAAAWARSRGYRRFHLGGGVSSSPQDSLFVFKSGFSDRRATLHTYHRVLAPADLRPPVRDEDDSTRLQRAARRPEPDFFPLYRR